MNTNLSVQDLRKIATGMQHNRLLTLSFPQDNAPYEILLVNRLEGEESLSRDFRFVIEILSDNVKLDPNEFVGKLMTVKLLRNDGSYRYFNGHIFSFRLVRTDGGIVFYEAEMGPWTRYLTLRKNNRLFLDESIGGQTATIFSDYGTLAVWQWKVRQKDPSMTMACQFDEHDHNYVHRRWEHMGLCYWYEHTATQHTLIISDPARLEPVIDGESPKIPYQDKAGSQEADGVRSWSFIQRVTSTHIGESTTDFKAMPHLNARTGGFVDARTDAWASDRAQQKLEWYDYAGQYAHRDWEAGEWQTSRRIEAIEAMARQWEASGNNRFVMPGRWFQLTDRFGDSISRSPYDDEYLITFAHHLATNNYLQGVGAQATYSNRFTCVKKTTPWRPMRGFNSVDTRILAPQTAIVVGPEGESLYTDEYGRVLLQFHWDREGKYTTWVRVSSGWAGGGQGMSTLPRIGSEVVVQWVDGNPDHPLVMGRVGSKMNLPAWRLPHQRALTGIRSRELVGDTGNRGGGRSNHLVFDDTANAIQTQLRSDHAASQLSLGSITRIEDWQGRQDARGEGFELRTDAVGAIRSGKGMLISTEARSEGASHISDVGEPLSRLKSAQTLHGGLGKLAEVHQAQNVGADQARVAEALKSQSDGIHGSRGSGASFPELCEPHLLIAGAAGLEMTTLATAHLAAGQHVAITSGDSVSVATGKSLFASVKDKLSFFVQNAGMKLFAGKGKVEIQAQSDNIEMTAQKTVKVVSAMERVEVAAKQEILLTSGGAYIRIKDGNIEIHAPGKIDIKGSSHTFAGPAGTNFVMPHLPQGTAAPTDLEFRLVDPYGRPSSGVEYKTMLSDGSIRHGILDADGYAKISGVPAGTSAKVQYLVDKNPPKSEVGIKTDSDWSQFQSINVTAKPVADAGNPNDPDSSTTA
jgi:type VI secretion system VgrG family protein